MAKSYLDKDGLLYFWQKIKVLFVSDVTWDSTNKKIQKTKAGSTSDVVTLSTVATSGSYNDLSNKPTLATVATSGSYNDLVNKPTIPTLKNVFGKVKVGSTTVEADTTQDTLELVAGSNVTLTPDATNDKVTIAATDTTYTQGTGITIANNQISNAGVTGVKGNSESSYRTGQVNITAANIGAVPTSRTVNGHALSANVEVTNPDLGNGYGTCSTAAATAAKVVSLSNYVDKAGGHITVAFQYDVPANATLNVNNTGAYDIYYQNGAISAGIIKAGNIATFVKTGSAYLLLNVDSGNITAAERTKLSGIATGAEVNQNAFSNIKVGSTTIAADGKTDTFEIDYSSGIDLTPDATNDKVTIGLNAAYVQALAAALGGISNGLCPLNASAKIDSTYLPSYVDDVIEAYARSGQTALSSTWLSTTSGGSALTPETGKIYVLMADSGDYAANTQFRWSGSAYVKLADGGVSSITNAEIDTIVAA